MTANFTECSEFGSVSVSAARPSNRHRSRRPPAAGVAAPAPRTAHPGRTPPRERGERRRASWTGGGGPCTRPVQKPRRPPAAAGDYAKLSWRWRRPSNTRSCTSPGREVPISNPRKVLFPAGRAHQARSRPLLPRRRRRRAARRPAAGPNVLVRYPNGIGGEFFYQKRAPDVAAAVDRGRRRCASRRAAPPRRSCRATPPRSRGWPTSPASSCIRIRCAPTISIIPTSCASISIRCPASTWAQVREVARVVRATLADLGLVGWPKTSGSRGMHIYVRIERRWTLRPRCAAPRWRSRARSSGARRRWRRASGGRRSATACSSTTTRTPRIARSPRAYSVRPTPDARVSAPLDLGRGRRRASPADFTLATMPARFAERRRSPRRHRRARRARSTRCSSCRRARSAKAWATRRGRRTTGSRPASRRACAPSTRAGAPKHPLIEIGRARSEGGRARRPRALEGAASRRGRAPRSRPTCSSTRCAAASRTWTRIRVNLQHVPAALRPAQEALDPDDDVERLAGDGERRLQPAPPRRRPSRARKAS